MLPDIQKSKFLFDVSGIIHIQDFVGHQIVQLATDFENTFKSLSKTDNPRPFIRNALTVSPSFNSIIHNDYFKTWLQKIFTKDITVIAGDITRYSGVTKWHRDINYGTLPLLKLVVYIDLKDDKQFDFFYLPGTHLCNSEVENFERSLEEKLNSKEFNLFQPPSIKIKSGDAIIFSPRLLHSVEDQCERKQFAAIFGGKPCNSLERAELIKISLANISVL